MSTSNTLTVIWDAAEYLSRAIILDAVTPADVIDHLDKMHDAALTLPDFGIGVLRAIGTIRDGAADGTIDMLGVLHRVATLGPIIAQAREVEDRDADDAITGRVLTISITESADESVCHLDAKEADAETVIGDLVMALCVIINRASREVAENVDESDRVAVARVTALRVASAAAARLLDDVINECGKIGQGKE